MRIYNHIGGTFTSDPSNVGSTLLRHKNIVAVYRDGIGMSKIKTFGIPSNKEVVYFSLTGNILVDGISEPGTVTTILYQNLEGES